MFNTNKIVALQKKSADALSIFRQSIAALESANKELRFEKSLQLEKKALIEEKLNTLSALEQENTKFVNKISQIFED